MNIHFSLREMHVPFGQNILKLSLWNGESATEASLSFSLISLCHSLFSHFRTWRATMSLLCIRSESMRIMQERGSSLVGARSPPSTAAPGFTITQSDQCISLLIGMKISRFSKILMLFFFVQDATASGPFVERIEKKWEVKKWNLEPRVVSSREILSMKG